jgi:hypothetical protein
MDKPHTSATHRTVQRRLSGIEGLRRAFAIAQAAHRLAEGTQLFRGRGGDDRRIDTTVHEKGGS